MTRTRQNQTYPVFTALAAFSLALLMNASTSQQAGAGIIVKEKTTHYRVEGNTGREISKGFRSDKKKSGYQHLSLSRHPIAYVHIELEVDNFKKANKGNFCRITDADITINAHYLFPKWVDQKTGSPALRKAWSEFYDYVVWHENEHVEIARDYARQYLSLLRKTKFPLLGECNVMPEDARKERARLVKAVKRNQKNFDKREGGLGGGGYKAQLKLRAAR